MMITVANERRVPALQLMGRTRHEYGKQSSVTRERDSSCQVTFCIFKTAQNEQKGVAIVKFCSGILEWYLYTNTINIKRYLTKLKDGKFCYRSIISLQKSRQSICLKSKLLVGLTTLNRVFSFISFIMSSMRTIEK